MNNPKLKLAIAAIIFFVLGGSAGYFLNEQLTEKPVPQRQFSSSSSKPNPEDVKEYLYQNMSPYLRSVRV